MTIRKSDIFSRIVILNLLADIEVCWKRIQYVSVLRMQWKVHRDGKEFTFFNTRVSKIETSLNVSKDFFIQKNELCVFDILIGVNLQSNRAYQLNF